MPSRPSHCTICGQSFSSMKALRQHKDKEHRITDDNVKTARKSVRRG